MDVIVKPGKLNGRFKLSGAKNSALKLMAASLLTEHDVVLRRFPGHIMDARIHIDMLERLGKECDIDTASNKITIKEAVIKNSLDGWEQRSIRNTLLILGCLTARVGNGCVPLPGGCKIGERKYDLHQLVLESLGADVWEKEGYLFAERKGPLMGTDIHFPIRSTGATESAILSACLANGQTRVWNPHVRPEIIDLINMLNAMGASIRVYGQERIEIDGVESLQGADHNVIADNMEAITWVVGAAITGGEVEIVDFPYQDLEVPLIFLRESGLNYYRGEKNLIVRGGKPYPLDFSTGPYPGINSDMQPILAVYGACAKGETRIVDLRFPGRYGYAQELRKMGVDCQIRDNLLIINGNGGKLIGNDVRAVDLRAGAALLLAGMVADDETRILDAWQIERGYDLIWDKLATSGIDVKQKSSTQYAMDGC
jgi:UDP-N-acetylglucosamine 1-carboxyvinyltransferase